MKIKTRKELIDNFEEEVYELQGECKENSDYYSEDDERECESMIEKEKFVLVNDMIIELKQFKVEHCYNLDKQVEELTNKLRSKNTPNN